MLRIAESVKHKKQAQQFCAYLASQDIKAEVIRHEGEYEIWVERTEQVAQAQQEWSAFQLDPKNPRFAQRQDRSAEREARRKLKAHYRKHFKRSGNRSWFTWFLISVSVIVYLLQQTVLGAVIYQWLLLPPVIQAPLLLMQPWRLLTPIFLHLSILHIIFNMYWLYVLGTLLEDKEKLWFFILFIIMAALLSNCCQWLIVGPNFGGMSGVIYALFAYIWLSAKFNPMSGYWIRQDVIFWLMAWFILCFTGFLGPVANFAHLGGLVAGAILAALRAWRQ